MEKRATAGLGFFIWVEESTSDAGIAIILLMNAKRKVVNMIGFMKNWAGIRKWQEMY